jgi:hypothetical protein
MTMALATTEAAAALSAHAMAAVHRFNPEHPDLAQLHSALILLSATLNDLINSVREDEIAAGQVAPVPVMSRGPAEGIIP